MIRRNIGQWNDKKNGKVPRRDKIGILGKCQRNYKKNAEGRNKMYELEGRNNIEG